MTRPTARARLGAASTLAARILAAPALAALVLAGTAAAQPVPTDPANVPVCSMSPATVAAMFVSQPITLNGVAKAADSTQVLQPNCGFFNWSEQMFLWMTSPAPARYGGGSRIMFSPQFFTVSPEDSTGRRTFLVNNPKLPLRMALRKTELGPHGLPVLVARTGQLLEVQKPPPGKPAPPIVRLPNGANVRLGSARRAPGGELRLFDLKGAPVAPAFRALPMLERPRVEIAPGEVAAVVPAEQLQTSLLVRKFVLNKVPIFLDTAGNVIDVEPGQADGGVLLSQNGSLIYYITVANDVFAYHRTMQPATLPTPITLTFPMTQNDANAVVAFAAGKGHTILDPQALAIESKSSWVEASAVSNPSAYIQTTAIVPVFTKTANTWTPNGQTKTVKVVMVGLHVVGSTNGHGEMVWGTFEHVGNTPNATFTYNSTTGPKTINQNTSGTWTFTPSGATGPFNRDAGNVPSWNTQTGAITGAPIRAVPILRARPWGTDGSNAALNTQVIASNASVISQLVSGDVRANYFQVGTTWTAGGAPPSPPGNNQVGTNQLANSTLETFVQAGTTPGFNCFTCHRTNTVTVSHVYADLQPLP